MPHSLLLKYRNDWGAVPCDYTDQENRVPVTKVFYWYQAPDYGWKYNIHRDVAKIVREMQRRHTQFLGLNDIAFHFVVAGDGYVYEGRPLNISSPECLKYDKYYGNRFDVAFIGDYRVEQLPYKMSEYGFMIADYLVNEGKLHPLFTYSNIMQSMEDHLAENNKESKF